MDLKSFAIFAVFVIGVTCFPMQKRIDTKKQILNVVLGKEPWRSKLSSGDDVDEYANIAELQKKVIIWSDDIPDNSEYSNATIVMDFKKGVIAVRFHATSLGDLCFFTEDQSSYDDVVAEINSRKTSQTPIQQGTPLTLYALHSHEVKTVPMLRKMGGPAVVKMCEHCINNNGKVYHVLRDSTERMKLDALKASGFISVSQPKMSVPIIVKMEEDAGAMVDMEPSHTAVHTDDMHKAVPVVQGDRNLPNDDMHKPVLVVSGDGNPSIDDSMIKGGRVPGHTGVRISSNDDMHKAVPVVPGDKNLPHDDMRKPALVVSGDGNPSNDDSMIKGGQVPGHTGVRISSNDDMHQAVAVVPGFATNSSNDDAMTMTQQTEDVMDNTKAVVIDPAGTSPFTAQNASTMTSGGQTSTVPVTTTSPTTAAAEQTTAAVTSDPIVPVTTSVPIRALGGVVLQ